MAFLSGLFGSGLSSLPNNTMYQPTSPFTQGFYGPGLHQGVYGNALNTWDGLNQGVYGVGLPQGLYGSGSPQGMFGGSLSPWGGMNQGNFKYSSYWVHPKGFLVAPVRFMDSFSGYPSNTVIQNTGAATLDYTIPPTVFGGTVL